MATLYVMVGLPGSGKSYWAKSFNCPIVSSDTIRKELSGSEDDQSVNGQVFGIARYRVRDYLSKNISCVFDATNITRKDRKSILKLAPEGTTKIAVFVNTHIDKVYEQNASRSRVVPTEVIEKMYNKLTPPSLSEGFDEIIVR